MPPAMSRASCSTVVRRSFGVSAIPRKRGWLSIFLAVSIFLTMAAAARPSAPYTLSSCSLLRHIYH